MSESRKFGLLTVGCEDLEIVIQVCLCRDKEQCLPNVLEPESVVLVGGKRR